MDSAGGDWEGVRPQKRDRQGRESEDEGSNELRKMSKYEEFKLIVKFKDKSDKAINPLSMSEEIKNKMGGVINVKVLLNGNILIFCKSEAQRLKAMKVKHLMKRAIESFVPNQTRNARGVIYISPEITENVIVQNIKGADVESARRFNISGTAVLLTFKQESLPDRVSLGYMSYPVRQYIRPPLRCFKCQRFGHVAAACRGTARCGKCEGNHTFSECVAEQVKCCNCGGKHMPSSRECVHQQRAVEVEKVRSEGKMTYAEAIKKVGVTREAVVEVQGADAGQKPVNQIITNQTFLAFMVDVIWAARSGVNRSHIFN